ncbi:hypothetical protein D5R81_14530 [Parashewanella spongiae]|uniref:Uncharacterized protein n=1 Tax=Parashewanella spongiae TaxID=342950 RepID=A0A3A6TQK5_9GAMM|nr:hypothetical protein [Parashewanella spongiae]MCL1079295.1 hypothetical protein [Parashewanella spongiae]RJY10530.1 hypothetical protein D5R81_14530 [Parashewanella spongiae]
MQYKKFSLVTIAVAGFLLAPMSGFATALDNSTDQFQPFNPGDSSDDPLPLQLNQPKRNISNPSGHSLYFKFIIPANEDGITNGYVLFALRQNVFGDAQLFLKEGSVPSETDFDCKGRVFEDSWQYKSQICEFHNQEGGTYWGLIHAETDYSKGSLSAQTIMDFSPFSLRKTTDN